MAIDYAALKTEITTDPGTLGYAAPLAAGDLVSVASILNQVRTAIDIERDYVDSVDVFEQIVPAEWAALSAAEKDRLSLILGMGRVNLQGPNTRAAFAAAFGAGTTTRANVLALQTRKGSRAETLFGAGSFVRHEDVAIARDLT